MTYPFNSYFKPRMISTSDPGFCFTLTQAIRQYQDLSTGETSQYRYAPLTSIYPATYTTMQSGTPLVYQGIGAHQGYQGHGTAHADQEKGKLPVHNETWKTQGEKIAATFSPLHTCKTGGKPKNYHESPQLSFLMVLKCGLFVYHGN